VPLDHQRLDKVGACLRRPTDKPFHFCHRLSQILYKLNTIERTWKTLHPKYSPPTTASAISSIRKGNLFSQPCESIASWKRAGSKLERGLAPRHPLWFAGVYDCNGKRWNAQTGRSSLVEFLTAILRWELSYTDIKILRAMIRVMQALRDELYVHVDQFCISENVNTVHQFIDNLSFTPIIYNRWVDRSFKKVEFKRSNLAGP
jgi:hypothetical protein